MMFNESHLGMCIVIRQNIITINLFSREAAGSKGRGYSNPVEFLITSGHLFPPYREMNTT